MTKTEKQNYLNSIEEAVKEVANKFGYAVAESVLRFYGTRTVAKLKEKDYCSVLGDLLQIASDD